MATAEQQIELIPQNRGILSVFGLYFFLLGVLIQGYSDAVVWPLFCETLHFGQGYTLALTMTSLFSGAMAPIAVNSGFFISKKIVFLWSGFFYSVLCVCQVFIGSIWSLIVLRGLLGLCLGFLMTNVHILIGDLFPRSQRGFFVGFFGVVMGLASLISPLLSGYLLEHFSVGHVFTLIVPFAVVGLTICALFMPSQKATGEKTSPDILGALLLCLILASFYLLITLGGENFPWLSLKTLLLLLLIVLSGLCFLHRERHMGTNGILPLSVMKGRNIRLIIMAALFCSMSTVAFYYTISYYMRAVMGASAMEIGLAISLQFLISLFFSPLAGKALHKNKSKNILILTSGMLLVALYIFFALWTKEPPPLGALYAAMVIFGYYAMIATILYIYLAQNHVPEAIRPYAIGGVRLATTFGYGCALALSAIFLRHAPTLVAGFSLFFIFSSLLTLLTIFLTLRIEVYLLDEPETQSGK